eukprot:RCo047759
MQSSPQAGKVLCVEDFEEERIPSEAEVIVEGISKEVPFGVLSSVSVVREGDPVAIEQVPQLLKEEGLDCTVEEVLDALQAVRSADGMWDSTDCALLSRSEIAAVLSHLAARVASAQDPSTFAR